MEQLIERYCKTQISDDAWKAHSLPDHKNRLENLTFILGNKFLDEVTRDDMRHFREILEKMPPSRKKSSKKLCSQIIENAYY